jgi:hypothetical protein
MGGTGQHEIQQSCPHNATDNETLWRAAVKGSNFAPPAWNARYLEVTAMSDGSFDLSQGLRARLYHARGAARPRALPGK